VIIDYIRTSAVDKAAGLRAGVEKLFTEQASSVGARPALEQALAFVREGDVFVVTKIDRVARSTVNLCGSSLGRTEESPAPRPRH
jgi:DNA invertase Pin-like site-specific DNA recombinase